MEVIGERFYVLDGIPRSLRNTRQVLDENGLRLVGVTPENRDEIVQSLINSGYGPLHRFWIDAYDGERNGANPSNAFVISLGAQPGELTVAPASPLYPYRHLAERIPAPRPGRDDQPL